jgi:hypothetical protein
MAPVVRLAAGGDAAAAPALPAVVRLDLAELLLLAERCGGPRLPLDLDATGDDAPVDRLQERLAGGAPSADGRARSLLVEARRRVAADPAGVGARLTEVGLLDAAGTPHGDVVAALGVLAAPELMLVLDLAVRREDDAGQEARLRSWFAVRGDVVAQLATASGLEHELAWYGVAGLAGALTRAATIDDPAPEATEEPALPVGVVELPYEVFTDGTEAVRRGRDDLLAEVVRLAPATARVDDAPLAPSATAELVTALESSTTGRLRMLVSAAGVPGTARRTVGVVSWLRTDGGWRELAARTVDGVPTVRLTPVAAGDLGRSVAPVLAEVVR